jgi:hypothetical protein
MRINATASHAISAVFFAAGVVLHYLQLDPELRTEAHVTAAGFIGASFVLAFLSKEFLTWTSPVPESPPSERPTLP